MDSSESRVTSFIVKLWLERSDEPERQVAWHGKVTHVQGGEQHYVANLGDIAEFIVPFLEDLGWQVPFGWRVRRWVSRWRQKLQG